LERLAVGHFNGAVNVHALVIVLEGEYVLFMRAKWLVPPEKHDEVVTVDKQLCVCATVTEIAACAGRDATIGSNAFVKLEPWDLGAKLEGESGV
jgi:hypothetical protein